MMKTQRYSECSFTFLTIFLSLFCGECKNKGNPKEMPHFEVSNSIDSLQEHLNLPGLQKISWIMQPQGVQSSFSFGPQDFELIVYSPGIPEKTRQFIVQNLILLTQCEETAAIDCTTAKKLGIDVLQLEKVNNKCIIKGKVYDAKPILKNMSTGIIVITDFGLIVSAGTS